MNNLRRHDELPEEIIVMRGWRGFCKYCNDKTVKMPRSLTNLKELLPNKCYCQLCGQRYFIDIGDHKIFAESQWLTRGE